MKIIVFIVLLFVPYTSYADNLLCAVKKVRPNAQFIGGANKASLVLLQARYVGGDFPSQSEVAAGELICVKEAKLAELNTEMEYRVNTIYPGMTAMLIKLSKHLYNSMSVGKSAVPDLASAISIYTAESSAQVVIGNYTGIGSVKAYSVSDDPLWPVI